MATTDAELSSTEASVVAKALMQPLPDWKKALSIAAPSFAVIFGGLGNCVAAVFFWKRRKRMASNLFMFLLACVDGTVCFLIMPFIPVFINFPQLLATDQRMKSFYTLWQHSMLFATVVSVFLLDVTAIDRHRGVCFALKKQIKDKVALIFCTGCFVAALLVIIVLITIRLLQVRRPTLKTIIPVQIASSLFMIILYLHIFHFLRKRRRQVSSAQPPHPAQQASSANQIAAVKTIRLLFAITIVFVISYLPIVVSGLLDAQSQSHTIFTYIINHSANPFIYFAMNSKFRECCIGAFLRTMGGENNPRSLGTDS